ncbi:hypothetical protein FRUB_02261 [Fimbriiglobus ruber]|uniref:Uncharacterized protein n=1 Tax=Fimbriiglobus ruber TaxID=1908690 RepID=A0A225E4B4_9BACT|nr:hypothetical protein FRUB_02261 [Fimbriiglobus ruber]
MLGQVSNLDRGSRHISVRPQTTWVGFNGSLRLHDRKATRGDKLCLFKLAAVIASGPGKVPRKSLPARAII